MVEDVMASPNCNTSAILMGSFDDAIFHSLRPGNTLVGPNYLQPCYFNVTDRTRGTATEYPTWSIKFKYRRTSVATIS